MWHYAIGLWRWKGRWIHDSKATESPPTPGLWRYKYVKWVLDSTPKSAESTKTPVALPKDCRPGDGVHESAPDTLDGLGRTWAASFDGACVFDQNRWWHVIDSPKGLRAMVTQGPDTLWLSSDHGLFKAHLTATIPVPKDDPLLAPRPQLPRAAPIKAPLAIPSRELHLKPVQVTFPLSGGSLNRADSVAVAPDGTLWFADRGRLYAVRGGKAKLVADTIDGLAAHGLAPLGMNQGFFAWREELQFLDGGRRKAQPEFLPGVSAVAIRGHQGWAVACREDNHLPVAISRNGQKWRWAPEIPAACYRAVTLAPDGSAWMVGGSAEHSIGEEDHTPASPIWPVGNGVVVHVSGNRVNSILNPSTSLLCVAATAAGDTWAGGYDGRLLHVQGNSTHEYRIEDEPWVLGAVAHGNAVYIVGESLIGKLEGEKLARIPIEKLPTGTWLDATVDHEGHLWVVGSPGILDIGTLIVGSD